MKVAPDAPGAEVDPDRLERLPDPEALARARAYLARRFPALAGAPLDRRARLPVRPHPRHALPARPPPERPDWWLLGGGSGHGFKHGPALAELVADCIEGRREPEPFLSLGARGSDAQLRLGSPPQV